MAVVVDASVAIAWLFEDELDEPAQSVADLVVEEGAIVPSLWQCEVANVLLASERRGRCSAAFVTQSIERLSRLPIAIDDDTSSATLLGTLELARQQGLTVYDAAYLQLALAHSVPLATRDKDLIAAAGRAGIQSCGH